MEKDIIINLLQQMNKTLCDILKRVKFLEGEMRRENQAYLVTRRTTIKKEATEKSP